MSSRSEVDRHVVILSWDGADKGLQVAEYPGCLDALGGHPEPVHVMKHLPNYNPKSLGAEDVYRFLDGLNRQQSQEALTREVFLSILDEIEVCLSSCERSIVVTTDQEELNVGRENISGPWLFGVMRNVEIGGKPDMLFLVRVNLPFAEVVKRQQKATISA